MRDLEQYLRNETPALALLCQAVLSQQATLDEVEGYLNCLLSEEIEDQGMQAYAARKLRRKPTKVIGAGETPPPKTIVEALMGERAEEWVESIYSEFKGLEEQGVFSHGWTLEDLAREGIKGKPIPCLKMPIAVPFMRKESRFYLVTWHLLVASVERQF